MWGPLGNGFPTLNGVKHVGLVAGGIGQTPFLAYVRELLGGRGYGGRATTQSVERVSGLLRRAVGRSGRRRELTSALRRAAVHPGDGRRQPGREGFVTQLLERHGRPDHLVGCGPEPMLHSS
ncbi:MAG: hypothetical protein U0797_13455 [Gemmataceae bacterium]